MPRQLMRRFQAAKIDRLPCHAFAPLEFRMSLSRRTMILGSASAAAAFSLLPPSTAMAAEPAAIIDTHQHLWDSKRVKQAWLESAPEILRATYGPTEYAAATRGLSIRTVYMEVDVVVEDQNKEAVYVVGLCKDKAELTKAAVIGGHPASPGFAKYVESHLAGGFVKGVRQVLHADTTPAGYGLADDFVRGVRWLGEKGLSFDLCLRPSDLADGVKLSEKCPDTRFILDHCGNGDPKAFHPELAPSEKPWHEVDIWRRGIADLAKRPNVVCKISGIVARAPKGWKAEHLSEIVNHCLDSFGPDRVVFGSDWPVCLLGAPLMDWVTALRAIVAKRSAEEQAKLWAGNARKMYGLAGI